MQALKTVQACPEIIVERNQERAAPGMFILDEPKSMTAIRILKQDVDAVLRVGANHNRC